TGCLHGFSAQPDPAVVAAVFHRIAEQILNSATQRDGVGFDHGQIGRNLPFDLKTAFDQLQVAGRDRVFDHLVQLNRTQFVSFSPRFGAGDLQDLLDHSGQSTAFVADQTAVAFDLIAAVNHAVGQVLRR